MSSKELNTRVSFVRAIDESEEDYLYPESYFAPLDLLSVVKRALLASAPGRRID